MRRNTKRVTASGGRRNQLRIIGGRWRGRRLHFPEVDGLRPTPDRVRETLFNWLAPVLPGARCLDLFAGSGALGLEAASRGAAAVVLVDSARDVAAQLAQNTGLLQADGVEVVQRAALDWLRTATPAPFDVVFLDPPFGRGMLGDVIELLQQRQLLSTDAWVYIETGSDEAMPSLPPQWRLHRDKQAGQVCYRLYRVTSPAAGDITD